jgi:predicted NBD/HSP70 family sugar kinase
VVSAREVRRQLGSEPDDAGVDPLSAVAASDPLARRVLRDAGRTLGRVLASLCNVLNPELVVLGGELGSSGEPFAEGVRDGVTRDSQPANAEAVAVRPAQLGRRAELVGALAMAMAARR